MRTGNSYSSGHEPATAPPSWIYFFSSRRPAIPSPTVSQMADSEPLASASPKRTRTSTEDSAPDPTDIRALIRETVREMLQDRRDDETPGPQTSPVNTPGHSGEFNGSPEAAGAVGPDRSVWRLVARHGVDEKAGLPERRGWLVGPVIGQVEPDTRAGAGRGGGRPRWRRG